MAIIPKPMPNWAGHPGAPTPRPRGGNTDIHTGVGGDPGYGQDPMTSQQQLDSMRAQQKGNQQKIKVIQMQMSHLKKPNPKDKKAVAKYNAQKKKYSDQVKGYQKVNAELAKKIPALQNKVWEESGQYDKLLTGANRDAYLALKSLFDSYGLGSLADKIYNYVKNGESADTISIQLQDTPEYKERFAGNEERKKNGLPVLSPAEYLATEASYKQIMQTAGMPPGFYDQNSDFNNWIGKNVSPSEIQSRVDMATQATILSNPEYRKALNAMGIDDAHITAYFLDTTKALPYLQKAAATAQIGAEALRNNLQFDQGYAEQLATMGISADAARQGYQQIAGELDSMKALGSIYGEDWNQKTSEAATFGTKGGTEAQGKQRRLLSQERGAFGGKEGSAASGGLTTGGGAR
jgi:hypothetical protein